MQLIDYQTCKKMQLIHYRTCKRVQLIIVFEHGQSTQYTAKEHEENYKIGLRVLLTMLLKIYKDIVENDNRINIKNR